jgi:VCBS repeat-containing protein
MAAKTTTQVSWINGAAKDDSVLVNTPGTLASIHSFTVGNLLANDPGSSTFYDAYSYADGLTWQALSASTKTQVPPQHTGTTFTITTQYGGTVTVNKTTGAMTYTPPTTLTQAYITALGAGQAYTDSFFYVIWMGNQGAYSLAKATVSIAGIDDAATITGTSTGTTMEDVTLTATGNLSVVDPDNGESCFLAQSYTGTYGSLTVTPDSTGTNTVAGTGHWTYTLNNSAANVQALGAGETHTETFTVTSKGGTPITVTVTVVGTNDGPVVTNTSDATNGSAQEDTTYSATGQLSASDVDNGDHQHWSVQGSDTGAYGSIAVDGTGKWTYTLDNGAAQSLAEGESHNETFTIRIADDSGAYQDQTITVTVSGTEDAPIITSDAQSGSVSEGDDGGSQSAAGTVTYSDADLIDTHTFDVTTAAAHGSAGVDGDGNWTYAVADAGAIDALSEGDTMSDSFVVTVSDNHGGTASQTINITIVGTNDGPVITSDAQSGAVSEGDNGDDQTATGQVTYSDVDANDTHTMAVTSAATSGSASVDDNGNWSYTVADAGAVDALRAGETMTDSFVVTVSDNHGGTASQTVDITITGTNDQAVFSGDFSGTVAEDNPLENVASGTISVADADHDEDHVDSYIPGNLTGVFGTWTFDSDSGAWTYTLDNTNAGVQALNLGDSVTDVLQLFSVDGTEQDITVTIDGANEIHTGGGGGDPPPNPSTNFMVNHGLRDINQFVITGFDDNDYLTYAANLNYLHTYSTHDGNTYVEFDYNTNAAKAHAFEVVLVGYTGPFDDSYVHATNGN